MKRQLFILLTLLGLSIQMMPRGGGGHGGGGRGGRGGRGGHSGHSGGHGGHGGYGRGGYGHGGYGRGGYGYRGGWGGYAGWGLGVGLTTAWIATASTSQLNSRIQDLEDEVRQLRDQNNNEQAAMYEDQIAELQAELKKRS